MKTLFETGEERKEKAISGLVSENQTYICTALDLMWKMRDEHPDHQFTGEDVKQYLIANGAVAKHPNVYGAVIRTAIKTSMIRPTGAHKKCELPAANARSTPIYRWK